MNRKKSFLFKCWLIALSTLTTSVYAEEDKWELGFRLNAEVADGKPANDILGYGFYGLYLLNEDWKIGYGLDVANYDLENPAFILGIPSTAPKVIDADASSTMVSVWGERYFNDYFETSILYLKFGIGFNSIDVDNATGPSANPPGTFNIQTDVSSDTVLFGGVGLKKPFGDNWNFDSTLGYNQHFGKWTLRDLDTSATATVDGFSSFSVQLGLSKAF